MTTEPHRFKRLVLGLQPRQPDNIMRLVVELAELLKLDLLGLFLEDTSLQNLARIPFAREFRMLGGGWHTIDVGQVAGDLAVAAQTAEKTFAEAVKHLRTQCRFEIARGPIAATIATVTQASDIVVIGGPMSAAERVSQQFSWLIEAAWRSAAALMIVPSRIACISGPIVAIATTPHDPSIAAAANFAVALNEELVVVDACDKAIDEAQIRAVAAAKRLAIRHIVSGRGVAASAGALEQALCPQHERLIVVTRGISDGQAAWTIGAARQVPVLVIEPVEAPAAQAAPANGG
jgi:hypothetical protein